MFVALALAGLIGFVVSFFSLGPTTILSIRRYCTHGFWSALLVGMGSALADAMYAIIPAFGLRGIAEQLQSYQSTIEIIGGIVLIGFGLYFAFWQKPVDVRPASPKERFGAFGTGWVLNAVNPGNALAFLFGMTFFGLLSPSMSLATSTGYVLAIAVGSVSAWVLKTFLIHKIGAARINEGNINTLTRWMGWLSVGIGLGVIVYALL